MPGVRNDLPDYGLDAIDTPVNRLIEGLPIRDLIEKHSTEFEIKPEEEEGEPENNSAESCFNFDELEKVTNLDLIDPGDDEDISPFDKYRRKMHSIREDNQIMKHVVKEGFGSKVPDHCIVYIRYHAYVEFGEVPFDSTLWQCSGEGDLPVPFNLGKRQLLQGLHEAILSMKKEEKAEFLVHPDLAFGKFGCPPRIPQDATILFIVEVDRFIDIGDMQNENEDLDMEERKKYSNIIKTARGHYLLANDLFKRENYSSAASKYRQVINMMHNARLANEQEEKERNHFLVKNYSNACICYNKLKNYKKVCIMAADAMQVNESEVRQNPKILYFWGIAKLMLNDFKGAKKHLMDAKKLKPNDPDISQVLITLEKRMSDALQREKMMMKRAFGFQHQPVKITEYDESEELFRKKIKEQLEELINNPAKDSMILKGTFTSEEEKSVVHIAVGLGLYARVTDGARRTIRIDKPADF